MTTRIAGCRIQTRVRDEWRDLPLSSHAATEIEAEILDHSVLDAPEGYVAADGREYRWGAEVEIEEAKDRLLNAIGDDLANARDMNS